MILDPVINSGHRTDRTVSESSTVSFTNYSVTTALDLGFCWVAIIMIGDRVSFSFDAIFNKFQDTSKETIISCIMSNTRLNVLYCSVLYRIVL